MASVSARPLIVRRSWLRYLVLVAALVVLTGAAGFAAAETDTVKTYSDGLWWSLSLMTTVGWSGPEPVTLAGHAIAAVTMVMGFVLLAFVTAAVASFFVREDEEPRDRVELTAESQIVDELRLMRTELQELRARVDGKRD